jgi:sensor domain CHASE-containing protein
MFTKRNAAIIIILNTVIALILIAVRGTTTLLNKADDIDENRVFKGLWRTMNTLDAEVGTLENTTADWAEWDDTYQYMLDRNEEYTEANLSLESFSLIDVDEVIFIDQDKKIALSQKFDFENDEIVPLSADLEAELIPDKLLGLDQSKKISGMLVLPQRQLFVAINPILTSKSTGESRGLLIMVRDLDEERLSGLSDVLNLSLMLQSFEQNNLPSDVKYKIFEQKDNFVVLQENDDYVVGYHPIVDVYGQTSGVVKVSLEREVMKALAKEFYIFMAFVFVVNALTFGANNYVMRKRKEQYA